MKTKLLTLLLAVATTWAGQAEARWPSKKMIVGAVLGAVIYKAATANAKWEEMEPTGGMAPWTIVEHEE